MRIFIQICFLFGMVFTLTACGTGPLRYSTQVDSLASPNATQAKTYLILPGNAGVTADDLQYQEFATYVMRSLTANGFVEAKKFDDADVAVVLTYGIGDPQTHEYSYSLPTFGQTGVSSSQTSGIVTSSGSYSATTTYTPSFGVTGYVPQTGSVTTYFRYVVMAGYDLKVYQATGKQVQLWRTRITSTGTSGDLRTVFPIMIAAAEPYVGVNSGKQVTVELKEGDKSVLAIKGISVQK